MSADYLLHDYDALLLQLIDGGTPAPNRTGTPALRMTGAMIRCDMRSGRVPVTTFKRLHWKSVVAELLWFLSGDTNVSRLQEQDVTIWNEWADMYGDLGPVYGHQWRHWNSPTAGEGGIDQIAAVIESLRTDPHSRRHIVSAWNPEQIPQMALAPCHALFQFHVNGHHLDCTVYQRSADVFLGVPFNLASYGLLAHMIAWVVGLLPGQLVWFGGDVHLYENHVGPAEEYLQRREHTPIQSPTWRSPTLGLEDWNRVREIDQFRAYHLTLAGYTPLPSIKAEVSK